MDDGWVDGWMDGCLVDGLGGKWVGWWVGGWEERLHTHRPQLMSMRPACLAPLLCALPLAQLTGFFVVESAVCRLAPDLVSLAQVGGLREGGGVGEEEGRAKSSRAWRGSEGSRFS